MKICIAQTNPIKGNVEGNLENHKRMIEVAVERDVDIIVFPELSLTGYEPELAKDLATTQDDKRFDEIQKYSDKNRIVIGLGMPTSNKGEIFISMIIFQPYTERITYSKQHLFQPENEIFKRGNKQVFINLDDQIVSPAICYELSNPEHSENAKKNNATIYIASVLNSVSGINNDSVRLSSIAKKYKMTVFMSNYVGKSGGYDCAGKSSVWNTEGELVKQLDDKTEGLLLYDTHSAIAEEVKIN